MNDRLFGVILLGEDRTELTEIRGKVTFPSESMFAVTVFGFGCHKEIVASTLTTIHANHRQQPADLGKGCLVIAFNVS